MNFTDLLIIYLACGAPFGVFYFLLNRKRSNSRQFWIKTILIFLFWMPFAFRLLKNQRIWKKVFAFKFDSFEIADSIDDKEIGLIQQRLEKMLSHNSKNISIFEIREVLERFVGLTLVANESEFIVSNAEKEIFKVNGSKNVAISSNCLHRRNLLRLKHHHKQAGNDFLKLIGKSYETISDKQKLSVLTLEFVNLINDSFTKSELLKIFTEPTQTDINTNVKDLEKVLWTQDLHKQQPAKQISMKMRSFKTTAKSSAQD